MAMLGAETLFVDTNVLVYASVMEAPLHGAALQAIQSHEQAGEILWISRQVLRDTWPRSRGLGSSAIHPASLCL